MIKRKKTRQIHVGPVAVGGGAPVSVQSMTSTDTRDVRATAAQIRRLVRAGCEIVRVAVPDESAARALSAIVGKSAIPVIADIHFHARLALMSMDAGVAGIRINPGNIGGKKRLADVIAKAGDLGLAVRIGVNAGSLERDLLKKHTYPTPAALVESALRNIDIVEALGCRRIKVSLKSADVLTSIEAYRMLSRATKYPLHIGITEAGTAFSGTVKTAVGLGVLLAEGIGDTLRVSLSADPVEEVRVGYAILQCLGLRAFGPELISCPTCGRCQIDVIGIAGRVEKKLAGFPAPIKVAVMGCEVNGPGEAAMADIGLAGSRSRGVIFKKGVIIKKCSHDTLLDEFMREIETFRDRSDNQ